MSRVIRLKCLCVVLAACFGLAGLSCQPDVGEQRSPLPKRSPVPSFGQANTLDVASWNVNWFGSSSQGPQNDGAQRRHVREVLQGSDADLWALTEVVETSAFMALLEELPDYSGLLASDPRVRDGARFYDAAEQKPAIVFKRARLALVEAELILVDHDADFAGRPPLRVTLRAGGELLQVVVLHAKAYSDSQSYARRLAASTALKAYLDRAFATAKLLVVGDFNDEISRSISRGRPSPYEF
jgi:endonuclease/exonuclease/phosphatase family metal-dependent hydrolase